MKKFIILLIFLFYATSLYTTSSSSFCSRCQKKIDRNLEILRNSCAPVEDLILSIIREYRELQNYYEKLKEERKEFVAKFKRLPKRFDELSILYKVLYIEAGLNGLLLDEKLAKIAYEGGVSKEETEKIFGIPIEAYTFDEKKITELEKIINEEKKLVLKWDEEKEKYLKESKKLKEEFQTWLKENKNKFTNKYKTLQDLKGKLLSIYRENKYPHCLGEYDEDKEEKLPTFDKWFPYDKTVIVFKPIKDLPEPPWGNKALPPIPLVLNGKDALRAQLSILKTEVDIKAALARAKILQGIYLTVKTARDISVGILKGGYELPASFVKPLKNLIDSKQGWLESLKNTVLGYGEAIKGVTWDPVVGATKDAKDFLVSVSKLFIKAVKSASTTDKKKLIKIFGSIINSTQAALENYAKQLGILKDNYPKGIMESLEEVKKLKNILKSYDDVNKGLDAMVKGYKEYVLKNVERAVNIGMTVGIAKSLKNGIKSSFEKVAEKTKKFAEKLKEVEKKSIAEATEVKKVLRKPVKEKVVHEEKITETMRKKYVEKKQPSEKIAKTQRKPISEESKAQGKISKTEAKKGELPTFETKDGKKIVPSKFVGEGAAKIVYEYVENGQKMVIKIFNDKSIAKSEIIRMGETARRLKKAGLPYEKYKVIKLKDGSYAVIEKKFDPKTLAENVLKEKKWTSEHTKAYIELITTLNKKGYILGDPNLGNIRFYRDSSGKLVAELIDLDGVISIKEVLKEKGLELVEEKNINLTNPEEIIKIQRDILLFENYSPNNNLIAKMYGSHLGESLATSKYHIEGKSFIPVSTPGAIGYQLKNALSENLFKEFVTRLNVEFEKVKTSEFFNNCREASNTPASKFVEELMKKTDETDVSNDLAKIELEDISVPQLSEGILEIKDFYDVPKLSLKPLENL